MHQAEIIVLVFAAVAVLAVVACKLALPYPIVLIISGLALSFVPRLPEVRLNPDIVFYFFFAAASLPGCVVHVVARFLTKSAADSFARNWAGAGDDFDDCVDSARHSAGTPLGGSFCAWGHCLPARRDCGHDNHSQARCSSSHPGNP
jgi:hypothetical protein